MIAISKRIRILISTIALLIIIIVLFVEAWHQPYFRNSVHALGKNLYYVESETEVGFIYRDYYEKNRLFEKERTIVASSFGYRIMDDIVDIDHDGTDELLCTCTWGGDGVVRLYIYKSKGEQILCGEFTPESIGADDIYMYGSGAFITYYDPCTSRMLAEYTTVDGCKEVELTFDQLEF